MTLATQLSLKTMELLQNELRTYFKALTLTLLLDVTVHQNNRIDLGTISQRCCRRVTDARCKWALILIGGNCYLSDGHGIPTLSVNVAVFYGNGDGVIWREPTLSGHLKVHNIHFKLVLRNIGVFSKCFH